MRVEKLYRVEQTQIAQSRVRGTFIEEREQVSEWDTPLAHFQPFDHAQGGLDIDAGQRGERGIVFLPSRRYLPLAMDYTVINLEEKIGKTVGRRTVVRDSFRFGMALQRTATQLSRALGYPRYPKGVFRFHSHEEADAWLTKHQIQPALRKS